MLPQSAPPADPAEPVWVSAAKKPSRWVSRLAPLAVGGLLLGGGGLYALKAAQSDGSGGSGPEAAVQSLFDAVGHEDVLGMLAALTPPEREALVDPVKRFAAELGRIGVTEKNLDLSAVKGVDFEVKDLTLQATKLTDNLAEVQVVGGTLTATAWPDRLPIGDKLRDLLAEEDTELPSKPSTETSDLADANMRLMVVRRDGRWGVSLGYTIAESARKDAGEPRPTFGQSPVKPQGARSPGDVMTGIAAAIGDGDVPAVIGRLDPEEMAPVYDYAPLFLDDANRSMRDGDGRVRISGITTKVSGSGDVRRVQITGFRMEAGVGAGGGSVTLHDGCWTIDSEDEQRELCGAELGDELSGTPFEDVVDLNDWPEMLAVTVHQVDGLWYLSPTRTGAELLIGLMGSLGDDAVPTLANMIFGFGNYE